MATAKAKDQRGTAQETQPQAQDEQAEATQAEPGATSAAPAAPAPPPRPYWGLEEMMGKGRAMPFHEEELFDDKGNLVGVVLLQGLTQAELDSVNETGEERRDSDGKVIREADKITEWYAKVVARASRHPETRKPLAALESGPGTIGFQALAERIYHTWMPGHIRQCRARVLKLSGFGGEETRAAEKKGS